MQQYLTNSAKCFPSWNATSGLVVCIRVPRAPIRPLKEEEEGETYLEVFLPLLVLVGFVACGAILTTNV